MGVDFDVVAKARAAGFFLACTDRYSLTKQKLYLSLKALYKHVSRADRSRSQGLIGVGLKG